MRAKEGVAVAATVLAVAAPMLVVHWVAIGHGIFAQTLAVLLWGLAITAWAAAMRTADIPWNALRPLLLALALVALGISASAAVHGAPAGVWAGSLGVVAAAIATAVAGALAARHDPEGATRALMWGLLVAALASLAIATVQLAAPGWADPRWVAPARTPGRASGNLVQPNHLATLLLWAWLAVAVWPTAGEAASRRPRGELPRSGKPAEPAAAAAAVAAPVAGPWAFVLVFGLQAGVVATASRSGLVASLALAIWAALDRRLPRSSAWLLWSTALGGLAVTLGRALMAPASSLGAGASLVRPDARSGVFVDTLQLISEHPLSGVGWMEFQLAWSLSPLGDRGPRYYEHAHNIVLNLVVEMGLPLGLAICAALIWGAVELLRSIRRVAPALQPRALMLAAMLGTIGIHSLFDAPFWYAYLLLPAAWAWGTLVGLANPLPARRRGARDAVDAEGAEGAVSGPAPAGSAAARWSGPAPSAASRRVAIAAGGMVLAGAALAGWLDFRHVLSAQPLAATWKPATVNAAPHAGRSRLFGYYVDHQRALNGADAVAPELFRSARWVTIDTPLLAAWIAALERADRHDEARYLMQRALEFRDPAFMPWLAACRVVAPLEPPPRCRAPGRASGWRDFR